MAQRKSAQVIFTTHSNDALVPLPPKAIWAAYDNEVLQGKLDINSLRTITGQIDAKLAIFVEDDFAVQFTNVCLRYYGDLELDAIQIHSMGGFAPAMKVNEQHNLDPTAPFPSVCVLDGDQRARLDPGESVYCLPGDRAPEAYVFDRVLEKIDEVAARLTVSMQLPGTRQERVKAVVLEKSRTNQDRHVIFEQIGEALDFTSGFVVAGAFLAVWAQEYREELIDFIAPFQASLPASSGGQSGQLPLPTS